MWVGEQEGEGGFIYIYINKLITNPVFFMLASLSQLPFQANIVKFVFKL